METQSDDKYTKTSTSDSRRELLDLEDRKCSTMLPWPEFLTVPNFKKMNFSNGEQKLGKNIKKMKRGKHKAYLLFQKER